MTRVVVELTADEDRLLNAFRRATSADEKMRAGLQKTGATVGESGKMIADAMAKAATQSGASIDRIIGSLRQTGTVGRKIGSDLAQFMSDYEVAGKRSVQSIIADLEKVDSVVATQAQNLLAQFERADREEKFTQTTAQIEALGGKFVGIAAKIRQSTAAPLADAEQSASALVRELEKIDPAKAEAIRSAITAANAAAEGIAFDKMVAELGSASAEAQSLVRLMGTELKRATLESAGGIDTLKGEILKMYPEMRDAIAQWEAATQEADKKEKFAETTRQIGAMGGEYAKLALMIRDATSAPMGNAEASAANLVRELEKIDPSKAQAIQTAMQQTREAVEQARVDELLRVLSSSSDEARELATAIGDGVSQAALQAQGGIEGIASEIVALRPELSGFVEQWRSDVAEAARYGEGQFKKMLDELRAGDKVSRQVAEAIKKNMIDAGLIGQKSFEAMIEPLKKLHPTLAAEAQKLKSEFTKIEERGKGSFEGIGARAKTELGIIFSSYVGVQEVIQKITESMQEQAQLRSDAANAQRSVAEVEADSRKNLAGFSANDRDYLLGDFVKEVMKETTFSDRKALVETIGTVASAGATDVDTIKRVVTEAAMLTAPSPGKLSAMAPALVDVAKATGNADPGQASAYLMEVGRLARIQEPEKVFRTVAPVMSTGFQTAGEGQGLEGALQGGAIFAAMTQGGTDVEGNSSQTAAIQFIQRMDKFFEELNQDPKAVTAAKRDLAQLRTEPQLSEQQQLQFRQLQERQQRAPQTEREIAKIDEEIASIDESVAMGASPHVGRLASDEKARLAKQRSSLEKMQFGEAEEAKLADILAKLPGGRDYEAKVAKLQETIEAGTIPRAGEYAKLSTPEEQLRALQSDTKLRSSFQSEEFGEERYRPIFKQLVEGGRAFQEFETGLKALRSSTGNTRLFDEISGEMLDGSPQLRTATYQRRLEIGRTNQLTDDVTAALANFRADFATIMKETRSPNSADAFGQSIAEPWADWGGLGGAAGPEEVVSGIQWMMSRKADLEVRGVTAEEENPIERLTNGIEAAIALLASANLQESSPENVIAARQRAADALRLEMQGGMTPGGMTRGGMNPGTPIAPDEFRVDVLRRLTETLDTQLPKRIETPIPKSGQSTPAAPQRRNDADLMSQGGSSGVEIKVDEDRLRSLSTGLMSSFAQDDAPVHDIASGITEMLFQSRQEKPIIVSEDTSAKILRNTPGNDGLTAQDVTPAMQRAVTSVLAQTANQQSGDDVDRDAVSGSVIRKLTEVIAIEKAGPTQSPSNSPLVPRTPDAVAAGANIPQRRIEAEPIQNQRSTTADEMNMRGMAAGLWSLFEPDNAPVHDLEAALYEMVAQKRNDSPVMVSRDSAANLLQNTPGNENLSADDVRMQQQRVITDMLIQQSNNPPADGDGQAVTDVVMQRLSEMMTRDTSLPAMPSGERNQDVPQIQRANRPIEFDMSNLGRTVEELEGADPMAYNPDTVSAARLHVAGMRRTTQKSVDVTAGDGGQSAAAQIELLRKLDKTLEAILKAQEDNVAATKNNRPQKGSDNRMAQAQAAMAMAGAK